MEMESIKKTLKEITLEVEHLKKKSGVTDASISNRLQEMEERISGAKNNIESIDKTVREDAKAKKLLTQNVQEIQDTMRRPISTKGHSKYLQQNYRKKTSLT